MKQHGKKARQERALERLKKAFVSNNKGWKLIQAYEAEHGSDAVPGAVTDLFDEHKRNWQERRDAEIAILEERIARS
jgi:hypothetical protein